MFKNSSGQTIIELIIAVGVGALVLTAIAASAIITVSNAQFSQKKTEAIKYLQQGIEEVRIERDSSDWQEFLPADPRESTDSPGNFTRKVVLTKIDNDSVSVRVTVSWDDAKGTHEVSSDTILSQWSN